jgi:hypothetical protein
MAQNTQMTRVQKVQRLKEVYINTVLAARASGNLPPTHTAACDLVIKENEAEILEMFPFLKNLPDNSYTPKQDPSRTEYTKGARIRLMLPDLYKKLQGLMQG